MNTLANQGFRSLIDIGYRVQLILECHDDLASETSPQLSTCIVRQGNSQAENALPIDSRGRHTYSHSTTQGIPIRSIPAYTEVHGDPLAALATRLHQCLNHFLCEAYFLPDASPCRRGRIKSFTALFKRCRRDCPYTIAGEQFGMEIASIFGEERETSGERAGSSPCPSSKSVAV